MRDLGFPVAVPALPRLNWVNLGSCSLSIFDIFLLHSKMLFGQLDYYPSNSKIQNQKRERGEGREGGREGGL